MSVRVHSHCHRQSTDPIDFAWGGSRNALSVRNSGSVACDKSWTSIAATDLSANPIAVMQIHYWDGPGLVFIIQPHVEHIAVSGQWSCTRACEVTCWPIFLDSTFEFPRNTLAFPHNNHKCCEFSIESITNIINYIHSECKNWYDIILHNIV